MVVRRGRFQGFGQSRSLFPLAAHPATTLPLVLMGYRDDREALRQKAETLTAELEETRELLEETRAKLGAQEAKDVQDEAQLAALSAKLKKLEKKAARQQGTVNRPFDPETGQPLTDEQIANQKFLGWTLGGLLLVVFVVFMVMLIASPKENETAPTAANPTPARPSPPIPPARTARVVFQGEVVDATGISIQKGAPCTLHAELVATGQTQTIPDLYVICGSSLLYKKGETNGDIMMSNSKWEFWEKPGPAPTGPHHYQVLFEDRGTRNIKLFQITLDSREKKMRLFRDEPERATVEVRLHEESGDVQGERLFDSSP